jgi:hypothetical protein
MSALTPGLSPVSFARERRRRVFPSLLDGRRVSSSGVQNLEKLHSLSPAG